MAPSTKTAPLHIIGIGGIGMSAIAEVLHARGFAVQGSDQKASANTDRLGKFGIKVFTSHAAENIAGVGRVAISTAVKPGNPEFDAAKAQGLPVLKRMDILAEAMAGLETISVTGTHGKTTTTSLMAHLLTHAGRDPTVITGGIVLDWGTNARVGKSRLMVVEADESDGTFARIPTTYGVVTNIDPEHLDYFGSVEAMHAEFRQFLTGVAPSGAIAACVDHPVVRQLIEEPAFRALKRTVFTYGWSKEADLRLLRADVKGRVTSFDAVFSANVPGGARTVTDWQVPVPGEHNALNALAVVAIALKLGLNDQEIARGLQAFAGVKRRYQPTGTWQGVEIFDDYGHHPVEIKAVLKAARAGADGRKVIAICEPHRYTRLRDLYADFASAFGDADHVIVGPLYAAGEKPIDGVSHAALAERIKANGHASARFVDQPRDLVPALKSLRLSAGDTVLCFGAGQSTEWAHALPEWLAQSGAE
jgi:UDP-N-acetylmuramate--alanine ligase